MKNKITKEILRRQVIKIPIAMFKADRVWFEISMKGEVIYTVLKVVDCGSSEPRNFHEPLWTTVITDPAKYLKKIKRDYYNFVGLVDDFAKKGHNTYLPHCPTGRPKKVRTATGNSNEGLVKPKVKKVR